jgi:hypothetical protein
LLWEHLVLEKISRLNYDFTVIRSLMGGLRQLLQRCLEQM